MPDANGHFRGAAYPNIPWETGADRRRAARSQAVAEAILLKAFIKEQETDDAQPEQLRDLRA